MTKPKSYDVSPKKDPKEDRIIKVPEVKTRKQVKTARSAEFSYYDKATRKEELKLKKKLKEYTYRDE